MRIGVATMALAIVLAGTGSARADGIVTPFAGATLGGATSGEHVTYGGAIGYMGAGVFGFEVDFGYAPQLLEGEDDDFDLVDDANATTLMANVILGVPIGGGPGVRPYVSGGLGLIRTQVSGVDDFFEVDNNAFGANVGAGLMGFVSDNVGLRGDVRYFRNLTDPEGDNEFDIDFGDFDFWRITGGVTFRF